MKGNVAPRPDTGLINSSPVTTATPLRLQAGCSHTIRIPVRDADGDIVRCRRAVWTEECSGACDGLPGALLNQVCAPLIISSEVFIVVTERLQNTDTILYVHFLGFLCHYLDSIRYCWNLPCGSSS